MVDSTNPRVMADNIKELAAREVGSTVEANPTGAATGDLEKLGVDGTIYGIPVGTAVEANPEGAATDELEKLGVGSGIYNIPKVPNYSTTEHKTGRKWIDDSDIWECTFEFDTTITVSYDVWTNVIDINNINVLISANSISEGVTSDGRLRWRVYNGYVQCACDIDTQTVTLVDSILTVEYTKVTTP